MIERNKKRKKLKRRRSGPKKGIKNKLRSSWAGMREWKMWNKTDRQNQSLKLNLPKKKTLI